MKLTKKEQMQVDKGLEITFMHIKEVIEHPKKLDDILNNAQLFPIYIKEKNKEALLLGVKPTSVPA